MEPYQIEELVDRIEALIREKIANARPGHDRLASSGVDAREELRSYLGELFGVKE